MPLRLFAAKKKNKTLIVNQWHLLKFVMSRLRSHDVILYTQGMVSDVGWLWHAVQEIPLLTNESTEQNYSILVWENYAEIEEPAKEPVTLQ